MLISDEWDNFLERIGRGQSTGDADLQESSSDALELRFWASYRGQTLARTGQEFKWPATILILFFPSFVIFIFICIYSLALNLVRGMMYYRRALMLQSYLERKASGGVYLVLFFPFSFIEFFCTIACQLA